MQVTAIDYRRLETVSTPAKALGRGLWYSHDDWGKPNAVHVMVRESVANSSKIQSVTLESHLVVNNGLPVIRELPDVRSSIRVEVYDQLVHTRSNSGYVRKLIAGTP